MRSRIVFLVVSIFVCLLSGWLMGAALPRSSRMMAPPTAASSPTPQSDTAQAQVNILLLVIENRNTPSARLDGIWVMTLTPDVPNYYLIGFATDTPVRDGLRLNDYYAAGSSLADAGHFVEGALELLTEGGLKTQYRVVIDHETLAQLVDAIGGVTRNGRATSGEALIAEYASLPGEDVAAQLEFQRAMLQALTEAVVSQAWNDARLQTLFAEHRWASADAEVLLAMALQAVRLGPPQFHITTYQPPAAP